MTEPTIKEWRIVLTIRESGSFRAASRRLDMAPSTLSHLVTGLERKLGRRLFNRTTRSVGLTPEGEALLAQIAPLLAELDEAIAPRGSDEAIEGDLRINVPLSAGSYLLAKIVPDFAACHPGIRLDLRHEERLVDIVAEGCDAGVRLERTVSPDMIGVPFGERLRFLPVASPSYLAQRGTPTHPSGLMEHRCIRTRMPRGERYAWEFARGGEKLALDVPGSLTLDRMALMIEAAAQGLGIAFVLEQLVEAQIADGTLVPLLLEWCPADERYMLYYPGRRHVPSPLRAFVDHLKRADIQIRAGQPNEIGLHDPPQPFEGRAVRTNDSFQR